MSAPMIDTPREAAAAVIRAALCSDHGHAAQQGGDQCRTCHRRAETAVDALQAAGWVLVMLPEPEPRGYALMWTWAHGDDEGTDAVQIGESGGIWDHAIDWRPLTPDECRQRAAALLAAAKWADAQVAP